jgi:anti-sigma factor ChrR (cupin superfamily)
MPLDPHDPRADAPTLDAEVLARLAAAVPAEPLAPEAQARIRRHLLRRIANEQMPQHKTVLPGEAGWEPLGPGLAMKRLHESGGILSYLVRLAPGAVLAAHRHPVDEECVVLEGEMLIGAHRVGPGGFHLGRAGVLHDRIRCGEAGALVFLRGAAPEPATLI